MTIDDSDKDGETAPVVLQPSLTRFERRRDGVKSRDGVQDSVAVDVGNGRDIVNCCIPDGQARCLVCHFWRL